MDPTIDYADPGYHDGPRLPLDTPANVQAAWTAAQTADNYTPDQLGHIVNAIRAAASRMFITLDGQPPAAANIIDINANLADTIRHPGTAAPSGAAAGGSLWDMLRRG